MNERGMEYPLLLPPSQHSGPRGAAGPAVGGEERNSGDDVDGADSSSERRQPLSSIFDRPMPSQTAAAVVDAAGGGADILSVASSSAGATSGRSRCRCCLLLAGPVSNLCSATLGAGILSLPYAFRKSGLVAGLALLLASALATRASIDILVRACQRYQVFSYERLVLKLQDETKKRERRRQQQPEEETSGIFRRWRRRLPSLSRYYYSIVQASLLVFCLGTAVAYVVAIGDILERAHLLLGAAGSRALSMALVWACLLFPLCLLRSMESLQCASGIGIASIATLVLAATIHLVEHEGDDAAGEIFRHWDEMLWPAPGAASSILKACPIVLFAFSCQVNVCAIYQELQVPATDSSEEEDEIEAEEAATGNGDAEGLRQLLAQSKLRFMNLVTVMAVTLCAILYTGISFVAAADFASGIRPNVLQNYDLTKGMMQAAAACMTLAVVMAFPLNIFPARTATLQLLEDCRVHYYSTRNRNTSSSTTPQPHATLTEALLSDAEDSVVDGESDAPGHTDDLAQLQSHEAGNASIAYVATGNLDLPEHETENFWAASVQHVALTLVLAGFALGVAILVPDISIVFGLLGGTTTSILGFIVPGLLGLQLVADEREVRERAEETIAPPRSTDGRTTLEPGERGQGATSSPEIVSGGTCLVVWSWLLLVGGVIVGVLTTGVTVYSTFF